MSNAISEEKYKRLKQEVEEAKAEAERAKGAKDQLMKSLEEEYECKTIKEAKALLVKLQNERDEAETAYSKALTNYEKKWKGE